MTGKVDLKKTLDAYRATRNVFRVVDVPDLRYLMLDGHGDPNTEVFATSIETLFPVAYALKFASKNDLGRDYVVPPLEALWTADSMDAFTASRDKSQWDWTLMIMVPDWVDDDMIAAAITKITDRGVAARISEVRCETLAEGHCVQTLHVGSFDDEGPLLERMHHEFIPQHGLTMTGRHHEIYLSDFRRTVPEKLKTILRQPVRAATS